MTILMEALEVTGVLSAPDLTQLTTGSVEGAGAFDVLMRTTKAHLQEEYDAGRITQDEYSAVYLGALSAVLQQSVQYLMNHQAEEKTIAEIGLIRQKTATELAQTDDTLIDGLGFNGTTAIEGLVNVQKEIAAQDVLVKEQQVLSAEAEVYLTKQKVVTELANTDDDLSGLPPSYAFNNTQLEVEGIAKAQKNKLAAESELTRQKVVTEVAGVNDILPAITYAQHNTTTVQGLVATQKAKTNQEIALLNQKAVSELAQTHDSIPAGEGLQVAGYTVSGVIGKQKLLFQKQTDGFDRDAEQKLSKIMVDSLIAGIAADNGTTVTGTNLDNISIGTVIANAMAGIT